MFRFTSTAKTVAASAAIAVGTLALGLSGAAAAQASGVPAVGQADYYSMPQGGSLTIPAPGILANDTDAEGDSLYVGNAFSYTGADSITVNMDGSFTFTPDPAFYGQGGFHYYPADYTSLGAETAVYITIEPTVPTPVVVPVANDDTYSTPMGTALTVDAASGLLANDVGPAYLSALNAPDGGVVAQQDGSFVYTPPAGFVGTTVFGYRITNGVTESNDAQVTITVTGPVGPPPVVNPGSPFANEDHYATYPGQQLFVPAVSGLLANDTDGGNAGLMIESVTLSVGGKLDQDPDGAFLYIPDQGFVGAAHFIYRAVANGVLSNYADVWIDVQPSTHKLAGSPDYYSTPMDTVFTTNGIGTLITNDADGTYVGGIDDVTGEVTVNIYGDVEYTPAPGFVGTKTFSYYLDNGYDIPSDWILVTIVVTGPVSIIPSNPIPHDPGMPVPAVDSELPTLAYTGSAPQPTWLLAPGLALVALGGVGLWFARRRSALS